MSGDFLQDNSKLLILLTINLRVRRLSGAQWIFILDRVEPRPGAGAAAVLWGKAAAPRFGIAISMKGDDKVIELLNEVLTAELTAINQYFIHAKMLENWGYQRLAQVKRRESIEEMKHADEVIERILYLDGVPNMQRLFPVKVGETVLEMHQVDLAVEVTAVERLNRAIATATAAGDNGSRALFEKILVEEEEAVDWLETHLGLIEKLGETQYLAEMIGEIA